MLECVVNISEGRRLDVVELIARNAGHRLLDVHTDADHNRAVVTVVGEEAARAVALAAVLRLDLRSHRGVHPRLGVVDVAPFVPLGGASLAEAVAARDRFARWMGEELSVPCFVYGEERTLPEIRRQAFATLAPDFGLAEPHRTAGATAVGARPVLVAYNLWLATDDVALAKEVAAGLRGPHVRALGLEVAGTAQVSTNLLDPLRTGPAAVYDAVRRQAPVLRAELVGLVPEAVLVATPRQRWDQLDLDADRTIEARVAAQGL
jgi:glutamate formiminotransferase / 5-formyltetrahydrofolate cyclo-ligase